MTNRVLDLLARGAPILADGAMGTMLIADGLRLDEPPETWNVEPGKRDLVRAIHRGYLDAGAQIILTNSFGGNTFRLRQHSLDHRVHELNHAAATLAQHEAGAHAVVAGSMGPTGERWEPHGALTYAAAVKAYTEQAAALAAGGTDVLWIETISDMDEARAATEGARAGAPDLPIVVTFSFHAHGLTMDGTSPADAVVALRALGVSAVGANCGDGPDEMECVIAEMHAADPTIALIAKTNLGLPVIVAGEAVYSTTPEQMALHARCVRALGATIIGACCGSTPAHIAAMRAALCDDVNKLRS